MTNDIKEQYTNPRKVITTYRRSQLKKFINYFIGTLLGGLTLFILYICFTSGDDTQELNKCLEKHTMKYCNKVVK